MAGGDLVVGLFLACAGSVCMGRIDLPGWLLAFAPNRRCRAGGALWHCPFGLVCVLTTSRLRW